MNELLPGLYDHIEPVALRIARRAALLAPVDAQRSYLVGVARRIVESGRFRDTAPPAPTPAGLEATLGWFELLDSHLDEFVSGRLSAGELIARGGGRLWEAFQARDIVCAAYGHGVARGLGPKLAGKDVLELGAGTGGTTRRMAEDLKSARRFVVSDVRQSFVDRIAADLPGVPLETALVDINDVPSPVSLVLSLFDGWWNAPTSSSRPQQGFLMPVHWFAAFTAAGFSSSSLECWTDGRRPFGGVYWAFT